MLRTLPLTAESGRRLRHPLMPLLLSVGLLGAVLPAAAQDYSQCRAISDDAARLRCFDDADRRPAAAPPAVAGPSPALPALPAVSAPPPAVPVQVPPPATAAAPPAAPVENFGAIAIPKKAPEEPREITARLIGTLDGVYRGLVLPLDNGQRWTVIDDREFEYIGTDPSVKLDRNFIGSYWMKILGGGPRFRVRRVK